MQLSRIFKCRNITRIRKYYIKWLMKKWNSNWGLHAYNEILTYHSTRQILQQMPWIHWIMIGALKQTYPPNPFQCMAEVQSKVLTRTSAGRWEAFISLWADRQTLIWQESLLHCDCEKLDYNTHTPSFQMRTYSLFLSSIYEYKTIKIQNIIRINVRIVIKKCASEGMY